MISPKDRNHNTARIAKNTGFLYMRMLLVLLVSLYTSRVVLDALGVVDFGIYNVVAGFIYFIGFFNSSLSNATQRFLSIELGKGDVGSAHKIFNQSLLLYFFIALGIFVVGEAVGIWFVSHKLVIPPSRLPSALFVFHCTLLSTVLTIIQIPYISAIIAREKMSVYSYVGIFEVFIKLIAVWSLTHILGYDLLKVYALWLVAIQLVITLFYHIYCKRTFPEARWQWIWDKHLLGELLHFISYNLYGCFAFAAGSHGVNIILNLFFGPTINAARAVANQVSSALNNFIQGIMTAVKPQMIMSYAKKDLMGMTRILEYSSKYSGLLLLALSLPLYFNLDFVLSVWLKEVPRFVSDFVKFLMIDTFFASLVIPLWIVANATGQIRRSQLYGRTFTLLALPLSYVVLVVCRGNISPVWIIALQSATSFLYYLYSLYDIRLQISLQVSRYFKKVLSPIALVGGLTFLSLWGVSYLPQHPMVQLITTTLTTLAVLPLFTYYLGTEKQERVYITQLVRQKIGI